MFKGYNKRGFLSFKGNMLKRLFDVLLSFFGLIIISPLFLIIIILIKFDSPGPVFYNGKRVGRFGKLFKIHKFRSMVVNAENLGGHSTAHHDSRVTRVGQFLRTYKLDELPQLVNVLYGEMSFVGPRPQVEDYVKLYKGENKAILDILPGMTDYSTIHFINLDKILGDKDVDRKYQEEIEPLKNKLRIKYVKDRSFWVDLKILFQTFIAIIKTIILKRK